MPLYRTWSCRACGAEVIYYLPASGDAYLVLDPPLEEKTPHECPEA